MCIQKRLYVLWMSYSCNFSAKSGARHSAHTSDRNLFKVSGMLSTQVTPEKISGHSSWSHWHLTPLSSMWRSSRCSCPPCRGRVSCQEATHHCVPRDWFLCGLLIGGRWTRVNACQGLLIGGRCTRVDAIKGSSLEDVAQGSMLARDPARSPWHRERCLP